MKELKNLLSISLLSLLLGSTLFAQNVHLDRTNRDIRIMENILTELFRIPIEDESNVIENIIFNDFPDRGVKGTYYEGYGVIFMIPSKDTFMNRTVEIDDEKDLSKRSLDEHEVKDRITEFFITYASTISQLKDNERIMVVYGTLGSKRLNHSKLTIVVRGNNVDNKKNKHLPVITASSTMKNIRSFNKTTDLKKARKQINFSTITDIKLKDLKIMGNIFDTVLDNDTDNQFHIRGNVKHLMIEDFGAILRFNTRFRADRNQLVSFGDFNDTFLTDNVRIMNKSVKIMENKAKKMEAKIQLMLNPEDSVIIFNDFFDSDKLTQELDSLRDIIEEKKEKSQMIMQQAYEDLKLNIIETLVDYGRTLKSVQSDQLVITSVHIHSRRENSIPNRVDFIVKKSVLEDLGKGKISRKKAMRSIVITEY